MFEASLQNFSAIALVMCSFWEEYNSRDRGEFANSATDGSFSGVNHPEISDECFSFK
jgi:hypothetical protein